MKKKAKVKTDDNQTTDWYKVVPDSFKTKYDNPFYNNHLITVPFRGLVVGASGSGKTTLLLELLNRMQDTFSHLILCVKSIEEPLYKFLLSKIDSDYVDVFEEGKIPDMEKYKDENGQILIVFDDLVNDAKAQKAISEWFIRARKIAGGCSCMYLTQSFYKTPKIIRLQCNYIFLKKLSSSRDLNMILKDCSLNVNKEELFKLYNFATSERGSFLLIDLDAPEERRFRQNFLSVIQAR